MFECKRDQRPPANGDQRLWSTVRQRTKTSAQAGTQNERSLRSNIGHSGQEVRTSSGRKQKMLGTAADSARNTAHVPGARACEIGFNAGRTVSSIWTQCA